MPKRSPKASVEIAQYEREASALELRSKGYTFSEIARELGFADASGASRAYHRALARKPAQGVDQIRAQEADRLEYLWRKVSEVIENPPLVHSAIGKTVPDPRPGREGLYLEDERAKISAITEYRHISESYRKMTGADIAVSSKVPTGEYAAQTAELEAFVSFAQEAAAERNALRREVAELRARLTAYERDELVTPAELVS